MKTNILDSEEEVFASGSTVSVSSNDLFDIYLGKMEEVLMSAFFSEKNKFDSFRGFYC